MSQITELLEKDKPAYIDARLEATTILMEELVKLLSPEQQGKLIEAISAIRNALPDKESKTDYQLSLSINKCFHRRN